ncbi:MAG: exodeoxyribonuclease VII small subunit [Bacteroidaceae bacterium]|jgi:exodeoxyribonuclease VII small subunit|nr:exodeoxyribonuclease VII small subunit [Bacteroidaceae bacterium]
MKTEELTYADAQKRLEEIVHQIEENNQDIDKLCDLVKEAKELLAFCKNKLFDVENNVKKIMEEEN